MHINKNVIQKKKNDNNNNKQLFVLFWKIAVVGRTDHLIQMSKFVKN